MQHSAKHLTDARCRVSSEKKLFVQYRMDDPERTSGANPTTVDDKLEQRCCRIIVSLKEILKEPDKPLTKRLARLFSI